MITKYIQIRHWDYWYSIYHIGEFENANADGVEFSITDDYDGDNLFFHFDIYNLPALKNIIKENEYIEADQPNYSEFINKYHDLSYGKIELFIGMLFYKDFHPNIGECNRTLQNSETIFSIKSPPLEPYYGDIFIGEEESLSPQLLLEWVGKISEILFKEQIEYQIANIPTPEEANNDYYKGK